MATFFSSNSPFTFPSRRWLPLLVVVGSLLIIGFYTVTHDHALEHNLALNGADWVGYAVCHRITERSFTINGRQLPLCVRCTGMYLGVVLVFVVLWLSGRLHWGDLPPLRILLILIGFIAIMGVDGINSYSHFFPGVPHLYTPQNWLRLLTGMGTGLAMGAIVFPALAQTLWQTVEFRPSVGNGRELTALLVVAGVLAVITLSNQPTILYVLALVSAAGVLLMVSALNTMLLLIMFRRDGRAITWQETAVPLFIGLFLAILEIGTMSYLRYNLTGTMTGFPGLP